MVSGAGKSSLAVVVMGVVASFGLAGDGEAPALFASTEHGLFTVRASGAIARVDVDFARDFSGTLSRRAALSPDHRWLAFTRDNDLWLLEVEQGTELPVTWIGKPFDAPLLPVYVLVGSWSPNSTRLVYEVTHGVIGIGDCEPRPEPLRARDAEYGWYEYDLETGHSRRLDWQGSYLDFLLTHALHRPPDGSFLVTAKKVPGDDGFALGRALHEESSEIDPVPAASERHLLRVAADGRSAELATRLTGWFGQTDFSADGHRSVVTLIDRGPRPANDGFTRIWSVDLRTGEATPLTPDTAWHGQHQFPKLSPSGRRVSYVEQTARGAAGPRRLIVDGERVFEYPEMFLHDWIDEDTVYVASRSELLVVEVATDRIRGRHPFSP